METLTHLWNLPGYELLTLSWQYFPVFLLLSPLVYLCLKWRRISAWPHDLYFSLSLPMSVGSLSALLLPMFSGLPGFLSHALIMSAFFPPLFVIPLVSLYQAYRLVKTREPSARKSKTFVALNCTLIILSYLTLPLIIMIFSYD